MHWSEKYIGMKCGTHNGFDCVDLARLVQLEVFGKEIHAPSVRYYRTQKGRIARTKAMTSQIHESRDEFVLRVDSPRDGDCVLMKIGQFPMHIGVYCKIAGVEYVLHAADLNVGPQVVLTRLRDLALRGLSVEGFYRWR